MGIFYFITVLSSTLNKLVTIAGKPSLLVKATPTSIITFSING